MKATHLLLASALTMLPLAAFAAEKIQPPSPRVQDPSSPIKCDARLSPEECAALRNKGAVPGDPGVLPNNPANQLPPNGITPTPAPPPPIAPIPPPISPIPPLNPAPAPTPPVIPPPPTGDHDLVQTPPPTGDKMPVVKPPANVVPKS